MIIITWFGLKIVFILWPLRMESRIRRANSHPMHSILASSIGHMSELQTLKAEQETRTGKQLKRQSIQTSIGIGVEIGTET